jgi:hypothetical protein
VYQQLWYILHLLEDLDLFHCLKRDFIKTMGNLSNEILPEIWHFDASPIGSTFTLNGELLIGTPP